MGKAAQAQAGRDRTRDARLKAARERRLKLDSDQLARERRIDEASVDVEVAWEERAQAEQAVTDAEVAAAAAIERLLAEKLAVKDACAADGAGPGDGAASASGRDRHRRWRRRRGRGRRC